MKKDNLNATNVDSKKDLCQNLFSSKHGEEVDNSLLTENITLSQS